MINSQIKDRILKLLTEENLSSSKFAEILQVQRSSISHILSGRNKPSLDFIQKVLKNFPTLNPDWLIIGKGEMYKQTQQSSLNFEENLQKSTPIEEKSKKIDTKQESSSNSVQFVNNTIPPVKNIERIVVFFDDGTFEELSPKKTGKKS